MAVESSNSPNDLRDFDLGVPRFREISLPDGTLFRFSLVPAGRYQISESTEVGLEKSAAPPAAWYRNPDPSCMRVSTGREAKETHYEQTPSKEASHPRADHRQAAGGSRLSGGYGTLSVGAGFALPVFGQANRFRSPF